jgi:hypothetical protein
VRRSGTCRARVPHYLLGTPESGTSQRAASSRCNLVTGRELGRLGIAGAQELESPGRVERPVRELPEDGSEHPGREAA